LSFPWRADATVVHVNAADAWVETGFFVEPGQTYAVSAVGRSYITMPNGIFPPLPGIGREGESGPEGQIYVVLRVRVLCAPSMALRLANFGDVAFTIGDAPTFTVPAAASPAQRVEHAYECRACPGGRQRFNLT
jgi:hypothetical protein